VDLRDSLIDAHLAWGLYLHMHAPLSRAEAHYRAALRLAIEPQHGWQQLARAAVAEEETAGWLAWVLAHQERWNEALEMYSRQRAVAIQSLEAAPDSADASRSVALGEHNVGYALLGLGRASEALERLDAALERLERLARADSDNSLAKTDVGRTLQIRADALEALGRHEEGLMATRRSLEIHEAQFQAEPENGAIRARVAWDLRRTAELWLAARRQPAAVLGHLQRAKQLSEKNLTLDPTGTFDRLNRARCLSTLAVLEAESSGTPRTDLAQASHSTQRSEYRSQALAAWQEIANDGLLPPSERGRLESLSSSR
jgi:tetratricopeptide (TPR) repeat protein